MTVSDEGTVVAVEVAPGRPGDTPLLVPQLDRVRARGVVVGEVVGDKAFDGDRRRGRAPTGG